MIRKTVSAYTSKSWKDIVPGDIIVCGARLLVQWPAVHDKTTFKTFINENVDMLVISINKFSIGDFDYCEVYVLVNGKLWWLDKRNLLSYDG